MIQPPPHVTVDITEGFCEVRWNNDGPVLPSNQIRSGHLILHTLHFGSPSPQSRETP